MPTRATRSQVLFLVTTALALLSPFANNYSAERGGPYQNPPRGTSSDVVESVLTQTSPAPAAHSPDPLTASAAVSCANPIVCENALPGTAQSSWRIQEPGDQSILGFATAQSVNIGETVRFKILTGASSYHIDVYRAGWYQGNGARRVAANVRPSARLPQRQPNCLVDTANSTGLIDCGNWAESASWTVPATGVSGVYFARLI